MSRCGFIFTTFNDADETKLAFDSFNQSLPTNSYYSVVFVDGGSNEEELKKINHLGSILGPYADLSTSLNSAIYTLLGYNLENIQGFIDGGSARNDYIFWLHPDMRFWQKGWSEKLITIYEACKPFGLGKLGPGTSNIDGSINNIQNGTYIWEGNQCPWVMSAEVIRHQLQEHGHVFDPAYIRCGGYEDWNLNADLISLGYTVCITGLVDVWHKGMGSRATYDTSPHQRHNAGVFSQIMGSSQQPGGYADLTEINEKLKLTYSLMAQEVIDLKAARDKENTNV
jgi:hypothetical protein